MATQQVVRAPGRYIASAAARYDGLRKDLRGLRAGRTFKVTCLGRYSATCARNALAHYCRHKLGYEIEAHQFQNVVEIKRTK